MLAQRNFRAPRCLKSNQSFSSLPRSAKLNSLPQFSHSFLKPSSSLQSSRYFSEAKPESKEALLSSGLNSFKVERYREAIDTFDKVLQLDPKHVEALYSRARALQILEHYALAVQHFDKVLQLDPKHSKALSYKEQAQKSLEKQS